MGARSSEGDKRMAADLKARGVRRQVMRAPCCHALIPIGQASLTAHMNRCGHGSRQLRAK